MGARQSEAVLAVVLAYLAVFVAAIGKMIRYVQQLCL
jgi:hypothetical protein